MERHQSGSSHVSVEEAVSREVLRKLRLAAEADTKEDREIVCEEVRAGREFAGQTFHVHPTPQIQAQPGLQSLLPPCAS